MSTDPLKLWNDTQPTLLINSVKLIKITNPQERKRKQSLRNIMNAIFIFSRQAVRCQTLPVQALIHLSLETYVCD